MANIRDVAKAAGVSPATVSRVLNNDQTYKITDETKQNVLRAVTELGYQPMIRKADRNARPKAEQRFSIGCLLATTRGKYRDPYYLSILSGVEEEMERQGGVVTLIHTEQELEDPEILKRTLEAGLDGLVMMRPLEEPLLQQLRERIPHIVGIDTGHMPIDNIEYDHFRVSRMAVEYLYQKGYREIGFIGGGAGHQPMKRSRRYRSYLETMRDLDLEIRPEWIMDCQWDDRKCMELVMETAKGPGLPRAIYASSDLMAIAALRALYQLNIRVPEQVAVIGMTDIEMSQYANPPLTTIHVPVEEMGRTCAKVLAERIRGDQSLPKRIILPSELVPRDSA
jgi:LacI family transcriptional regulator